MSGSFTCPKGCKPYDGKIPSSPDLTFVVGKSARPPFDKIGTHGSTLEACGCSSPTHRDDLIETNAAWWGKLNRAQRLAALAHEHGHAALGLDCEECCDRHGGMLMRSWGYTEPGIQAAYDSMIESAGRQGAGARALEGARHFKGAQGSQGYDSAWQLSSPSGGMPDQAARGLEEAHGLSLQRPATKKKASAPVAAATPAGEAHKPQVSSVVQGKPSTNQAFPAASAPTLAVAGKIDPGGPSSTPSFDPATPGDGNPNLLERIDETLTGVKIDKTIVVSEVVSGLLVAFLVFVIFRWGGKAGA